MILIFNFQEEQYETSILYYDFLQNRKVQSKLLQSPGSRF